METRPLEEIGLTKGEAKVYMALLDIGSSTTGQIIKTAHVSRSKVYEMLEKLASNGLVSFVIRENVKYYEAASPIVIMDLIEKRRAVLAVQKKSLEKTVAVLAQRHNLRRSPQTAHVYEGFEGIRTIYKLVLENMKSGDEYFACQVEPEVFKGDFVDFIREYHKQRAKKGVKVKLLSSEENRTVVAKAMSGLRGMEIRFTGRPLPLATLVFGDRVATFVWGSDPMGVVITSRTIASRYERFFTYLWKTSKH